jgi:regulator of replication initiation timing
MNDVDKSLEGIERVLNAVIDPNSSIVTMQRSNAQWLISQLKKERENIHRLKGKNNALITDREGLKIDHASLVEYSQQLQQENERYSKALKEILKEGYEEAGMQLDTFITKIAKQALEDQS